ncbi:ABC transporter peptide-binding protein [Geomicrobium sp. JCM 19037]|uniref:ABC transporter substrate-binding protein n=1 Tax=Geomicrobium sp. JCM 19037 TaxID=1460634 RepID=UPI00045F3EA7|nr:ABC transporter substrate-binding protein [Geomicrobium sp. JCM 19037]GAK04922.1 ABC transporter peptide-binding protein [Geomicrobium sp. JCM 19037]
MNKRFMMSSFLILSAMTVAACADPEPENAVTGTNEQGDEETPVTTEETENSVSLAWNSQPPTLDPHVTNTNVVRDLARPVFEQLVTFDESYEPIPMLADSFEENEDGSEITFYLREGVLFHNDEEMTADDVVASMEKWQSGGAPAAAMGDSTWQEVDEYTVKLHVDELPSP